MQVDLKLGEGAKVPTYATDGSGCFDIYATSVKEVHDNVFEYSTGLFFEIPKNKTLLIFSRSGQGFKHQTRLSNCVGVIDSDYRGELKVQLISDVIWVEDCERVNRFDPSDLTKAIAQGMIIDTPQVKFNLVAELSETERGSGGFGSTNK